MIKSEFLNPYKLSLAEFCIAVSILAIVGAASGGIWRGLSNQRAARAEGVLAGDTGSEVSRHIDEEAGVVCWTARRGNGVGIACLPLDDTRLER